MLVDTPLYVAITLAVPAATPVTMPALTVRTAVFELLHSAWVVQSLNVQQFTVASTASCFVPFTPTATGACVLKASAVTLGGPGGGLRADTCR